MVEKVVGLREIDALVAEKVMGYRRNSFDVFHTPGGQPEHLSDQPGIGLRLLR